MGKENNDEIEQLNLLLKASEDEGDEGGEGTDEYDEEYCKKYLKRYLKENPDEAKGFTPDLKPLKKAMDDATNAIEGLDNADATLIDGTEMVKAFIDLGNGLIKAFEDLCADVTELKVMSAANTDLAKASGSVLAKAATVIDEIGKTPLGKRSVDSIPVALTGEGSALLKAKGGFNEIRGLLVKAIESGDRRASNVITEYEISRGNIARLSPHTIKTIEAIVGGNQ